MEQKQFDVFISYSRKELDRIKEIKSVIEDTVKTKCWMDLNAIESDSRRFTKDIIDGINNCRVFLFMLSKNSQNSKFALKELDFAEKKGKHVVIVNIDNCQMNDEFLFLYGLSDLIDWNNEPQKEKLIRDLKKWIGLGESLQETNQSDEDILDSNNENESDSGEVFYSKGEEAYARKDYAEAVRWYRKSAEQGGASAQYSLGWMYRNGYGVDKDYIEAVRWYRKSAEQGNSYAQDNIGDMYYYGYGVDKDYAEAVRWYRKSAEQGKASAQYNLGWMYQNGYGVDKDYVEAVRWYRKSAEQGRSYAQYNLGLMYENGYGVEKSKREAVFWYKKAAAQGDEDAEKKVKELKRWSLF